MQGIRKGALWAPGDGEPPNDHHAVPITAPCLWTLQAGGFNFKYQILGPNTHFHCDMVAGPFVFHTISPGLCLIWAANTILNPAVNKFYGGWMTALPEYAGVPFALPDLMSLMSIEIYWATWLQPRPMADEQVVYGLYDGLDATNVRIKIDHS